MESNGQKKIQQKYQATPWTRVKNHEKNQKKTIITKRPKQLKTRYVNTAQ
jgi:hypothetical protein